MTIGSTGRILQHWLQIGARAGLTGSLVVRPGSEYAQWGMSGGVATLVDAMPWPSRRAPWHCLWHALRVARWARRHGVEIIHCNEHDVYPFATVLRRVLPRPLVCHVRFRLDGGFAEWAFGRRPPDALLWTSHQQKADSAAAITGLVPEERQHVVRLGVELADVERYRDQGRELRQKWGIRAEEILVGIPSPLRPRKKVEDFVTMFARLADRHPQVVGVIAGQEVAGDEAYRARIEQAVADSGLGRRLRWVGYLQPIEPFHHACDVSVSTSEYETFGNSVCEAMACGKAVAGYRGGSVAEVVGEAGMIVETGDVEGLTAAVERLVCDGELRRSLGGKAGERVATEFNPSQSLRQLAAIYASICTGDTEQSKTAASKLSA